MKIATVPFATDTPPTCPACRVYAWNKAHIAIGFFRAGARTHHPECRLVRPLFLAYQLERLARDLETGAPRADGPALLRRVADALHSGEV